MSHTIELANMMLPGEDRGRQVLRLSEGLQGLDRAAASAHVARMFGAHLLETQVSGVWQVEPPVPTNQHMDLGRKMLDLAARAIPPILGLITFSDRTRDPLPRVVVHNDKRR